MGGTTGTYTEFYVQSMYNNYRTRSVYLWFEDIAKIMSVEPLLGDVRGGTLIKVYGDSFIAAPNLKCRFNHIFVFAEYHSPKMVTCLSPKYDHAPVSVDFAVEIDQWHFDANHNFSYLYFKHPIVERIHPVRGYIHGGIEITIYGQHFLFGNFDSVARCRFGDDETYYPLAKVLNSTIMTCSSPPHSVGFTSVEVSMNNGVDWSDSGVILEYMPVPDIFDIFPSMGSKDGGTNITITAHHLRTDLTHFCVFNASINTTATVLSREQIQFRFVALS